MGEFGPWDITGSDGTKARAAAKTASEHDDQRRNAGARAPNRWRFTFEGWRMAEPESEFVLV